MEEGGGVVNILTLPRALNHYGTVPIVPNVINDRFYTDEIIYIYNKNQTLVGRIFFLEYSSYTLSHNQFISYVDRPNIEAIKYKCRGIFSGRSIF